MKKKSLSCLCLSCKACPRVNRSGKVVVEVVVEAAQWSVEWNTPPPPVANHLPGKMSP